MTRGAKVVRVSLRSDEGTIGEGGTIEQAFESDGEIFGYNVVWDAKPAQAQYVAPVRIVPVEEWEAEQRTRPAA